MEELEELREQLRIKDEQLVSQQFRIAELKRKLHFFRERYYRYKDVFGNPPTKKGEWHCE